MKNEEPKSGFGSDDDLVEETTEVLVFKVNTTKFLTI